MTKTELLEAINDYNDGDEDIYNCALHELEEGDMDMTIKEFLLMLLEQCRD
jgi:hypothetical protein